MSEAASVSQATQQKFLQLAEFLEQASHLARELAQPKNSTFAIPDLTPPAVIPKDQAWFWTKEWQIGEREANEALRRIEGHKLVFRSIGTHAIYKMP